MPHVWQPHRHTWDYHHARDDRPQVGPTLIPTPSRSLNEGEHPIHLGLEDRVLLISGGASGIGAAITRAALTEGAHVVSAGRSTPATAAFEAELADHPRCTFLEAELADPEQCQWILNDIRQHHGRLDFLVNNAGTNDAVGLRSGSPEQFLDSLRHNLLHYFTLAHFALPLLSAAPAGAAIVNISSKVALTGQGNTSAYAAAKGAQLALTREWAADLLPLGIRVNAVLPAEVLTPLYRNWLAARPDPDAALHQIQARIPLGHRMTSPEEIAAAVVFLLSPTQSGHTTGQHLIVDGGYTHLDRALT